ncbi:MAG: glycosyltransferase, partial [Gemmataceae bacterium]|nr:glycosyltransferase [Gemmataceae bacterium]
MARVSLCLIAKNAEASLPACLASTADLVDEIILVDTGSTDRTKEVAASFHAHIVDFVWIESFSAARNKCLEQARGAWIFYLDADEYLDEANRQKLRVLLRSLGEENLGYVMTVRSRGAQHKGWAVDVARMCLFRNRLEHRWKYRVHEQIVPALRATGASLCWTDIVLQHTGYDDATLARSKLERNLHLLRRDLDEHAENPFILLNVGLTYLELGQATEAEPFLHRSQERAAPTFNMLPLLFATQVRCLKQLGRREEALAVCAAGRTRFPADAPLYFEEGLLRWQQGDRAGAERCFRQLLEGRPEGDPLAPDLRPMSTRLGSFIPTPEGLRGYLTRHHLALVLFQEGRLAEAEAEWQTVLHERPAFVPALIGQGQLFLAQERWGELEQTAALLAGNYSTPAEAALLRELGQLARQASLIAQGELFLAGERWGELEQTAARLADECGAPVAAALLRARGQLARQALPEAHQILT